MADLVGGDFGLAEQHKLYACHDKLLAHKQALFSHLTQRWRDLFNASFDVLLYDLTSTYFEVNASDLPEGSKRRHGYSRDKRPDCPQLVIALVVTPEGLPLAYDVLPGNTADSKTLRSFLVRIESQYSRRGACGSSTAAFRPRRSWPRCARPIRPCSIWSEPQGTPDTPGKAARRRAVAQSARRRRGQAPAAGRRTLRLRAERRSRRQGARHAPSPAQMALGAIEDDRRHGRLEQSA
jgi:hypothetical protein